MPTKFTMASLAIAAASIAASVASPGACAQPQAEAASKVTATPTDSSPAEELANLEAQIPILEARAKIAKLKAEIDSAGATQSSPPGASPSPMQAWGAGPAQALAGQGPAQATSGAASGSAHSGMQAVSISGFDGRYQAALTIDGRNVSVRAGDMLEGGWKVASITESSVTLSRGKQVVVLRI